MTRDDQRPYFMAQNNNPTMLLRRTTSEESIIPTRVEPVNYTPSVTSRRRALGHRKGRAPAPPMGTSVVRSNSVNQVRHKEGNGKRSADWYRSRSTTRLNQDQTNNSSSCSTLSDEDSTPHVSRSNSYGKGEEDPNMTFNGAYDIYLRDDHLATNNMRVSTTTPSFNVDTPPGYEETISRQRLLKHYNRSNSFVITPSTPSPSNSNAKARLIFDDNSPVYQNPPPLPPKTERPPLPPKQRIRLSAMEDTYVNSAELLRQEEDLIFPTYKSTGARIHVSHNSTAILDNNDRVVIKNPPQLPPKESQQQQSVGSRAKKRSVTRIVNSSTASTQTRTMKNAETQTDETDFYLMYQDEHGNWIEEPDEDMLEDERERCEDDEDFSESNRSLSPDYLPSMTSRHLVYDNPEYLQLADSNQGTSHFYEHPVVSRHGVEMRQAGRRKLDTVQSVPVNSKTKTNVDPIIQGEINWSVSQLRTLFNQGQLSPAGADNSSSSTNSSGHNSSSSSTYNPRFTEGDYVESSAVKANKAFRQKLIGRKADVFVAGSDAFSSHADLPHQRTVVSTNDSNQADSDQESYV